MDISTREELINALMDAAELEHNLACLYLFAQFSLKKDVAELAEISAADRNAVLIKLDEWRLFIREIALQEMGHLGTVSNVLALVGANAHFDRPNFPPPPGYYPPHTNFVLQKFGRESLARFIEFERTEDLPGAEVLGIAPIEIPYQHVGELYQAILKAFEEPANGGINLPDTDLFLGSAAQLDDHSWSANVEVHAPATRAAVRAALQDVMQEGEAAINPDPAATHQSHYARFFLIHKELAALQQSMASFEPACNVVTNPMVRKHRGQASDIHIISNPQTADVAELFNSAYGSLLIALRQYYAFAGETTQQRTMLRSLAVRIMKQLVLPLGELLTQLPMTIAGSSQRAGPGFELYRPLYATTRPKAAWRALAERLRIAEKEANRLKALPWPVPAATTVFANLPTQTGQLAKALEDQVPSLAGG